MAIEKIKFGTSGWRGVIADDFIVSRVRVVTQAISDHIAAQGLKDKGVIVGYDTRFMSERFAEEAVKVLAANGIHTYLSNRDVPTPAVSFEIIEKKSGWRHQLHGEPQPTTIQWPEVFSRLGRTGAS